MDIVKIKFLGLFLLLCVLFYLDLVLGSTGYISVFDKFSGNDFSINQEDLLIITQFRLPKAISALLIGAALSISGLLMQTIFNNPLAGPYVLGISSAAGLGVAVVLMAASWVGINTYTFGAWIVILSAWIGAGVAMLLIIYITRKLSDSIALLILGMLLGSAATALVNVLQFFAGEALVKAYLIWTMGNLGAITPENLRFMAPILIAGIILPLFLTRSLNAYLAGSDFAQSVGVNNTRIKISALVASSVLAGTVTAFSGPIGFIGIAVPHIGRMIFRTADHFILLPASMLIGSTLLLLSDIISQLPGSGYIIPLNSVTSIIGIPVIIYLILRERRIF